MIFNGEIYNIKSLLLFLSSKNIFPVTTSDTEVLFLLLCSVGIDRTLELVEGYVCLLFFDKRIDRLYLVRDHIGMKPLFYVDDHSSLRFASTVDSLMQLIQSSYALSTIDDSQISSFLNTGFSSKSCFHSQINQIPPGFYLTYDILNSKSSMSRWYTAPPTHIKDLPHYRPYANQLDSLLCSVIHEQSFADVQNGIFLSGGIDSSLLASYLKSSTNHPPVAFSAWYPHDPNGSELAIASNICERFKFDFVPCEVNMFDYNLDMCVNKILDICKHPFGNLTVLSSYLLCKQASSLGVKVVFTGDGGDELFGGYPRYQYSYFSQLLFPLFKGFLFHLLS